MRTVIINREAECIPISLAELLPYRLTDEVRRLADRCGNIIIEEIRLRRGRCASVSADGRNLSLQAVLSGEEIDMTLNKLCGGSLYAFKDTICRGYLTLPGGIRAGVCGRAATENGRVSGVGDVSAIVLRLPHRPPTGAADELCRMLRASSLTRGALIFAPPGVGKTTVLRSAAATLASGASPLRVAVVDTRGELEASLDSRQLTVDILSGYPRGVGIEIAARTLGAQIIICDEIGDIDEARAVESAHNCGVPLIASAHAADIGELMRKPGIALLHKSRCFGIYAGLSRVYGRQFVYNFATFTWEEADACV